MLRLFVLTTADTTMVRLRNHLKCAFAFRRFKLSNHHGCLLSVCSPSPLVRSLFRASGTSFLWLLCETSCIFFFLQVLQPPIWNHGLLDPFECRSSVPLSMATSIVFSLKAAVTRYIVSSTCLYLGMSDGGNKYRNQPRPYFIRRGQRWE